ncbi:hypothetical protein PTE_00237 [Photorhabdus khanii NC19]|uniref:Uncharacterized protein n=1 Tax=Photorhabdus khanii NC19 TaxID=1004151 RepID=W3VBC5_9GAMM|nr:hypothetical protein PTE_00237 [Photorhabdus khanii NC19]
MPQAFKIVSIKGYFSEYIGIIGHSKEPLVDVLHSLIEEPNVVFEDGYAFWCALDDYINAKPIKCGGRTKQANFTDALIVNKSQRYGAKNKKSVSPLYTFDKAACLSLMRQNHRPPNNAITSSREAIAARTGINKALPPLTNIHPPITGNPNIPTK